MSQPDEVRAEFAKFAASEACPMRFHAPDVDSWLDGNDRMLVIEDRYRWWAAGRSSLITRVEAAEGALEAVRTYAIGSAATCREAESQRRADLADPGNHLIYDMLCEQRYAWEQKAASYDALIAFIDAQSALRASGTTKDEGAK